MQILSTGNDLFHGRRGVTALCHLFGTAIHICNDARGYTTIRIYFTQIYRRVCLLIYLWYELRFWKDKIIKSNFLTFMVMLCRRILQFLFSKFIIYLKTIAAYTRGIAFVFSNENSFTRIAWNWIIALLFNTNICSIDFCGDNRLQQILKSWKIQDFESEITSNSNCYGDRSNFLQ